MQSVRVVFVTLLVVLFAGAAIAQDDFPKVEVAAGYSLVRVSSTGLVEQFTQNGGSANIALNFSKAVGLVADVGGYNNNNIRGFNVDNTLFTYLFGPRFSYRADKGTIFGDVLLGGGHVSATANSIEESNNGFAMVVGGGFDINAGRHFAVRPVQLDYLMTRFNPLGASETQNNLRYSAMVVFKF